MKKWVNFKILRSSITAIIFTLLGTIFTSRLINVSTIELKESSFPFAFQANSILNMKNGFEISLVIYIMSLKHTQQYPNFIYVNCCLALIKSFFIGVVISIAAVITKLYSETQNFYQIIQLIYSSISSCFYSSAMFIFIFLTIYSLLKKFKLDNETLIISTFCTLNDICSIEILAIFSINAHNYSSHQLAFFIFLILSFLSICLIFVINYKDLVVSLQSETSIIITFGYNLVLGLIIEHVSKMFPSVNILFHVYSTIGNSVCYIYAQKIHNSINNNCILTHGLNLTLAVTSFACSLILIGINHFFMFGLGFKFLIWFAILLFFQVLLTNKLLTVINNIFNRSFQENFGSLILPTIISISDGLSLFSLVLASFISQ